MSASTKLSASQVPKLLANSRLSHRELQGIWRHRVPIQLDHDGQPVPGVAAVKEPVHWLADEPSSVAFAKHALAAGAFLLACDATREALRLHANSELTRVLAIALMRLGSHDEARALLSSVRARDAMTLALLGDCGYYEATVAGAAELRREDLKSSLAAYEAACELEPNDYGYRTRAASVALLLGEDERGTGERFRTRATKLAREALAIIAGQRQRPPTVGLFLETANAECVLGNVERARSAFERAAAHREATPHQLARARAHARLLAHALGAPSSTFETCFPALSLVVFSGHMVDAPSAELQRFPESLVPEARELILQAVQDLEPCAGFSSAAAGADLLFLEGLSEFGKRSRFDVESHVILPWRRESFRASSVEGYGPAWVTRFERALKAADSVRVLGEARLPHDVAGFEYANTVMGGVARLMAKTQGLDIVPLLFWNGEPGKPGGTSSFFTFWKEQGFEPRQVLSSAKQVARFRSRARGNRSRISIPPTEPRASRPRRSGFAGVALGRETKTLLFADVVGYSKLPEGVIPAYVEHFMGLASRLVAESRYAPISVNTWGDALYFVFERSESGGLFALELVDRITTTHWTDLGVFWEDWSENPPRKVALSLRTALHTGPVYVHQDPVVRRLGFTGAHVSRAARIEPITPHAKIYASEEFAAVAAIEGVQDFACDFVGTMPLAKKYPGDFKLYQVRRVRPFPLELLARAIHERYCARRAADGETPATNPSMAGWDALPIDLRLENRAQAANIKTKVRSLGFELVPETDRSGTQLELTEEMVLRLAQEEHVRYCESKTSRGWKYGPKRNDARKLHPSLVPWSELSSGERAKDIQAVRSIPDLLKLAGFRVAPITPFQGSSLSRPSS